MSSIEHASGKGSSDENFPVGSLLIGKRLRPHVLAFYRFARNADDIADSADLSAADKLARLDRMALVLDGAGGQDDAPSAAAMRASLAVTGIAPAHCHTLLAAFRQDAVKNRYADWQQLMDYCALSAAPVGRYLLDLHGESPATWHSSDALCAALQVINHLQDCAQDYRLLDRVYLPQDWLNAEGAAIVDLREAVCSAGLRRCLDRMVAATHALVTLARSLPGGIEDGGLRAESAIIVRLAERLLVALARRDPLATRVKLGGGAILGAVVTGLWRARRRIRP
jgi:squalene synthase HpnC